MSSVQFKLDSDGARALLRSPQMQAEMRRRAEAIARAAGPGFVVSSSVGANRARASVTARTREARLRQAREHVLERAIGSA